MRAFFYLSVIASLALPTFVSAAPQPIANENEIASRGQSGCSGCDFLQGIINDLQGPCNAITGASSSDLLADIPALSSKLNAIITIVNKAIAAVHSNHNILGGLTSKICGNLLGEIIRLVVDVIKVVLGLLSSCSHNDQVSLKALLVTLFSLLGDLTCLILPIVLGLIGGLLAVLLGLLGAILNLVLGLVGSLTGLFVQLPGCANHWPTGLGGTVLIL